MSRRIHRTRNGKQRYAAPGSHRHAAITGLLWWLK